MKVNHDLLKRLPQRNSGVLIGEIVDRGKVEKTPDTNAAILEALQQGTKSLNDLIDSKEHTARLEILLENRLKETQAALMVAARAGVENNRMALAAIPGMLNRMTSHAIAEKIETKSLQTPNVGLLGRILNRGNDTPSVERMVAKTERREISGLSAGSNLRIDTHPEQFSIRDSVLVTGKAMSISFETEEDGGGRHQVYNGQATFAASGVGAGFSMAGATYVQIGGMDYTPGGVDVDIEIGSHDIKIEW